MHHADLQKIADYVMPSFPPAPSDLGFLFGTRHGVPEFCEAAFQLWQGGFFGRLLVSGGRTGTSPLAEADVIAERLVRLGIPASALILETDATNTGENVIFGRARVAEAMDLAAIRRVVVIGKICSTRRYLMTLQKHWPGLTLTVCPVNYFVSRPGAGTSTRNSTPACSANSRRSRAISPQVIWRRSADRRDNSRLFSPSRNAMLRRP
jgi:uncharacterized SAM-binding protein YcdF (DUF218 family)